MTYAEWATFHSSLFSMLSDRQALMMADWADLFRSEGFTPEELKYASRTMAAGDVKVFPGEQINRLTEIMRWERRKKSSRVSNESEFGKCVLCMGCGIASVPGAGVTTIGGNVIDEDSKQYVGVICGCIVGRKISAAQKSETNMRTIESYAAEFPNWREEMERRRKLDARKAQLVAESSHVGVGGVIQRLANKFRIGSPS